MAESIELAVLSSSSSTVPKAGLDDDAAAVPSSTDQAAAAAAVVDVGDHDESKLYGPPKMSLLHLFLTFLSVGIRGFGGPVVQIGLMKQQFILEGKWMSVERFNRVYAFYQAIPGPEAAELAIFFGYTSNGFAGGILSGLGFVLPGFGIMLLLSWLYGQYGLANAYVLASFHAVQPVVTAMIFLSLRKIAEHGFIDPKTKQFTFLLFFQGFLGLLLTVMRVNFLITLAYCGLLNGILYWRAHRPRWAYAAALAWLALGLLIYVLVVVYVGVPTTFTLGATADGGATYSGVFGVAALAGLLTFGGAYTAIPYIQQEAVVAGQWITNQQFLDGLALANLVPTPLVMFVTFVGYLALSWGGAVLMSIGIFFPAFTFTLLGHHFFNRILDNKTIMPFLEGVTAAVIGIVLVTACNFLRTSVTDPITGAIFFFAVFVMSQVKGAYTGPILIAVAACCGQTLFAPQ